METALNTDGPIKICCLLLPRFNGFALHGLLEPLRLANLVSRQRLYEIEYYSFDGATVVSSADFEARCELPPERLDRNSLVLVLGGWGSEHYQNPRALSWLRLQARLGIRVCGVEIGAYTLARAGLLNGREATTHWTYAPAFQEQFADVKVVEQLFTVSDTLLTCAGGAAGIDMMLNLISEQHGNNLARQITDWFLHTDIRPAHSRRAGLRVPSSRIPYGSCRWRQRT